VECTERSFFEGMSTSVANHSSVATMALATPSNASIVKSVVWRGKVNRFLIVCTFVQECVTSYSQHTYWRFCRKYACMRNGAWLTSLRTVRKHAPCFEGEHFQTFSHFVERNTDLRLSFSSDLDPSSLQQKTTFPLITLYFLRQLGLRQPITPVSGFFSNHTSSTI